MDRLGARARRDAGLPALPGDEELLRPGSPGETTTKAPKEPPAKKPKPPRVRTLAGFPAVDPGVGESPTTQRSRPRAKASKPKAATKAPRAVRLNDTDWLALKALCSLLERRKRRPVRPDEAVGYAVSCALQSVLPSSGAPNGRVDVASTVEGSWR